MKEFFLSLNNNNTNNNNNKYCQSYLTTWSSSYGVPPETLPTKQPFWVRPALLADRAVVEASLNSSLQRAFYLSASSPHSGDWLFAMPITSCGLRLDDEAVRVAVGLRLGLMCTWSKKSNLRCDQSPDGEKAIMSSMY